MQGRESVAVATPQEGFIKMLDIIIGILAVFGCGLGTAYAIKWGEKKNIVDLGGQGRGANE